MSETLFILGKLKDRFLRLASIAVTGLVALISLVILCANRGYAGNLSHDGGAYAAKVASYSHFYSEVFGKEFDIAGYLEQREGSGQRRPAVFSYFCAPMALNGDCRTVDYNFQAISALFPEVYVAALSHATRTDLLFFYGVSSLEFLKSDIGPFVEETVQISKECWFFETSNRLFPSIVFYEGHFEGANTCSLSGMICYFKFGRDCKSVERIEYPDLIEIGASLVAPSIEEWNRIHAVLKESR